MTALFFRQSSLVNWVASCEGMVSLEVVRLCFPGEAMESFPNITGRHMGFNYYSYAAGDSLLTHDDTDQGYQLKGVSVSHDELHW